MIQIAAEVPLCLRLRIASIVSFIFQSFLPNDYFRIFRHSAGQAAESLRAV